RKRSVKSSSAKKTTKKKSASKSSRSTRARRSISMDADVFELPDVQAELEGDPILQRRSQRLAKELVQQVEQLAKRLMRLSPAYKADLSMPAGMQDAVGDNVEAVLAGTGGASILARF